MADLPIRLSALPPLPKDVTAGGRGTMRAAQRIAREQIRETTNDEHIAAVHKAKENVQALKREARKYGYRLARAKAQLQKLRPKVDQLHAHVNDWLEASTTASGKLVEEDRPPFDQDGFPIPNQQWRSATDAHKASTKGANEYHHVAGKRVPLVEAKSMRARDFRKLQQERFAHKDKRSRRSEVAESAIPTPGTSLSPNEDAAEPADGLRKRKREDEDEDPESDAKRMRTTAHESGTGYRPCLASWSIREGNARPFVLQRSHHGGTETPPGCWPKLMSEQASL